MGWCWRKRLWSGPTRLRRRTLRPWLNSSGGWSLTSRLPLAVAVYDENVHDVSWECSITYFIGSSNSRFRLQFVLYLELVVTNVRIAIWQVFGSNWFHIWIQKSIDNLSSSYCLTRFQISFISTLALENMKYVVNYRWDLYVLATGVAPTPPTHKENKIQSPFHLKTTFSSSQWAGIKIGLLLNLLLD